MKKGLLLKKGFDHFRATPKETNLQPGWGHFFM